MYDVVVVGQGLTGLLSAIYAKQQNKKVALVAKGTGKNQQSTGLMDLLPGSTKGLAEWLKYFDFINQDKIMIKHGINHFKSLMDQGSYPYLGEIENPVPIVTASGHVKYTALYPKSVTPIIEGGCVVVVGFHEMIDFQPQFMKGNLLTARPMLTVETMKVKLGASSQRTMTQLDAARLLDQKEVRERVINQIKEKLNECKLSKVDMFIFPSALGIQNWQETLGQFRTELHAEITEAPGLPPNASAVRFDEILRRMATRLGVRFYLDAEVIGCKLRAERLTQISVRSNHRLSQIKGNHFVLATGGALGGGLEVTTTNIKETALQLPVDHNGAFIKKPINVYPVGAALGKNVCSHGITGGIYSIVSSYSTNLQIQKIEQNGGLQHA
ncbi:hypothetical protein BKP45_08380 [Anaerobacillus alkalidiazotrophicus]|uniref:FAD-dependent oxidoreductase 2 FAD-binding domain-containing protein n=1 Tax=Anaerobacillus alkalidiazotrophicus TaxID=472963 RepID=A0A1S2M7N0_9BACI|nr:FAD-binding protein [Anaerobacillus alkalidiazotrophicus]OIJ20802.1 hypothetical protein BKP45_08380 [Anaerobacillus alkalidiazotrophicus]